MVGERKFKRLIPFVSGILLLITIFFAFQVPKTQFDYNFEKFYPEKDSDTRFYLDLREKFSSDNDFLLVAIPSEGKLFDPVHLSRIKELTKKLEKDSLVQFVMSVSNQEEVFLLQGGSTATKPYLDFNNLNRHEDSLRIFKNKELINTLVSEDGKAWGIYVRHQDYISKNKSDLLTKHVNRYAKQAGLKNVVLGGRTVGQQYYIDVMTSEMVLFIALSAVLVVLFLFIAFRSIWGILLPQVVIFFSMIWLIGGMAWMEEPINIILVTLPSVMFVVTMSDTIHLVSRYLDALRVTESRYEAVRTAVREVGMATFLTSLTTAVGFFSLVFVNVTPIKIFGIVMGIGVMIAFVVTFVCLPILFYIFPGPKYVVKSKSDHFWLKYLRSWFTGVIRNPKKIIATTIVVIALGIFGAMQIESNNYLMDDIHPEESIKQDFNFVDEHFGGVRPFSLALTLKDKETSIWDKELLSQIDSVENYLENEMEVHIRGSLVQALKLLNRGSNLGKEEFYALPTSNKKLRTYKRALKIAEGGKFLRLLVDSTEQTLLISGTMADVGNKEFQSRREKFEKFMAKQGVTKKLDYHLSGSAVLIDKNMSYMASSMVKGLLLSVGIVALIIGLIFRSIPVMLISLVPNLVPLISIAGIMGLMGVELKISTAIIFTIAFGIAVDDTIHFLGKYKFELMKGKSPLYALKRSYLTTGKAMILTTLILCSGFLLLMLSSFMGTYYMGILMCVTLFIALIADITILPVLLMLFYKRKPQLKSHK